MAMELHWFYLAYTGLRGTTEEESTGHQNAPMCMHRPLKCATNRRMLAACFWMHAAFD
jgi:hypothetical protein